MYAMLAGAGLSMLGASGQYGQAKKLAKQTQAEKDSLAMAGEMRSDYADNYKNAGGVNDRYLQQIQSYGNGAYAERLAAQGSAQAMGGLAGGLTARTDPSQAGSQFQAQNAIGNARSNAASSNGLAYLQGRAKLAEGLGNGINLGNQSMNIATTGYNTSTGLGVQSAMDNAQRAANQWGIASQVGSQLGQYTGYEAGKGYGDWKKLQAKGADTGVGTYLGTLF